MGAYVEEILLDGFILDEGKLRKITDLVESRIDNVPVIFKVHRGDSYSYETTNIEDVTNEDNEDWRAITKLQLLIDQKGGIEFRLRAYTKIMLIGRQSEK